VAQSAKQESDLQNLQQIVSGLSEGVILIDTDQTIRWANDAALALHGVTSIEALGSTVREYRERFRLTYRNNHPVDADRYPVERVVAGETFSEVVVEVTRAGCEKPEWMHQVRSMVLTDEDGGPERLVLVIQDVSLRFEAEERFEQSFNANPAPALICRLSDQRFVKVNRGFLDLSGFDRDAVIGRTVFELDLFNAAEHRENAIRHLRAGETIPQMEAQLQLAGGGTNLIVVAGQPIEMGEEPCMLFTMADLERRRRAESALSHSQARSERTFQMAPVAMMITTRDDQTIEEVNPAFEELTGLALAETAGKRSESLQLWETAAVRRSLEAELRTASVIMHRDVKLRRIDGALIECLVSATVVGRGDHPCVLWVIQDISERRRSELELLSSVEEVMKDASWFSRALVEKLANLRTPAVSGEHVKEVAELTAREKQVLGLICQGDDDAAIAASLTMSRNTVRNHTARIYAKIGVNKRGAAIVWARERGLGTSGRKAQRG
jgi:PAS domain S-box-containing protein